MAVDLRNRVPEFIDQHPDWWLAAREYLQDCYPNEGCGIFVATGFMPMLNVHPEPTKAFEMHPDVFIQHEVLGVVHAHPDGAAVPSRMDMQQQLATAVPWAVCTVTATTVSDPLWWGDELPRAPLVGRPFVHGVLDCYSLIRDWYFIERGVDLPEFPRDWDWWGAGEDLYETGFAKAGFHVIDAAVEPLQAGDVFLAKLRSERINHGGIYVCTGTVLHHVQNALSRRSQFELWSNRIEKWLRYGG